MKFCPDKMNKLFSKIPSCMWGLVILAIIILVGLTLTNRLVWKLTKAKKEKKEAFVVDTGLAGKYPDVFTLYKADWCPHCKKMEPEWEAAKKEIEESGVPVVMETVDVDEQPEATKEAGVKGFPTLKFKDAATGTTETYTGARDATAIKEFVEKKVAEKTA